MRHEAKARGTNEGFTGDKASKKMRKMRNETTELKGNAALDEEEKHSYTYNDLKDLPHGIECRASNTRGCVRSETTLRSPDSRNHERSRNLPEV